VQKEAEETELEQRWSRQRRRKSKNEADMMKMSAATNMVLGGLFVVLNFIYQHNFRFVNDYRCAPFYLLFSVGLLCVDLIHH